MKYKKELIILAFVQLLVLFLFPTASHALPANTIVRSNGVLALAQWPQASVTAFKSNVGTFVAVCVDSQTGFHCGETPVSPGVFQVTGLNRATLSPVTVNICVSFDDFGNCIQNQQLTVQVTWTASGTPTSTTGVNRVTSPGML